MSISKNEEMVLEVARSLPFNLLDQVVFLGGSVISLLITEPGFIGIRPTKDVDLIIDANRRNYHKFESALQAAGFKQVLDEEPPVICRWRIKSVLVDVMPCDSAILGFSIKWYSGAVKYAQKRLLEDIEIKLVTAPYFIATKIEAFLSRGKNDFMASPDMEDIITLLDGRSEIVSEIEQSEKSLQAFLIKTFTAWLSKNAFLDALPGHLPPDAASQDRLSIIFERLQAIANL
ncbi:MAG: hypothetical protein ACOYXC_12610 [Candidatus Rifleibacteriota bacterium]